MMPRILTRRPDLLIDSPGDMVMNFCATLSLTFIIDMDTFSSKTAIS